MQAAEFLGCDEMRNSIIQWLQAVLKDVVQHGVTTTSEKVVATSLQQSCTRVWHLTEVISFSLHHLLLVLLLYVGSVAWSLCSSLLRSLRGAAKQLLAVLLGLAQTPRAFT